MIDPKCVCEEYLPRFAIIHDLDVQEDEFPDGSIMITTIVSYEKLSELSLRLFAEGYVIHEFDGNITEVMDGSKKSNEPLVHFDPLAVVVYKPFDPVKPGKGGNTVSWN